MKTESQIQREICDWLHDNKYFFWRHNQIPVMGRAMPKYSRKGMSDVFVIIRGQIFAMEVKRPSDPDVREKNGRKVRAGMLSHDQAQFALDFSAAGGKFRCVRSLDEAIQFIRP